MLDPRRRPFVWSAVVLAVVWGLAVGGYFVAKNAQVTAAKVRSYAASIDFRKLSPVERERVILKLAAMLNALSPEERRQARLEGVWREWFAEMTELEKGVFIEATMPTGVKQMIEAFEKMPDDRRQQSITQALRRLEEARAALERGEGPGTNAPALSKELEEKITKTGLSVLYRDSSAQTKAELAPLLEELQQTMQSRRRMHGPRP